MSAPVQGPPPTACAHCLARSAAQRDALASARAAVVAAAVAAERASTSADAVRFALKDLSEAVAQLDASEPPPTDALARRRLALPLEAVEQAHTLAVLADVGGVRVRAAERLGVSVSTLARWLERWGCSRRPPEGEGEGEGEA